MAISDNLLATNLLRQHGFSEKKAHDLATTINELLKKYSPEQCWHIISTELLPDHRNFSLHFALYQFIYPNWQSQPAPAWSPTPESIAKTNLAISMAELKFSDYPLLHRWSTQEFTKFWDYSIKKLAISFDHPYQQICSLVHGIEKPYWLPGAKLNIAASCFKASADSIAIIFQAENQKLTKLTYGELDRLSNRVANSLQQAQIKIGDPVAIIMPMNIEAIAIYLGIVKAGCTVVSIADSFAPEEISTRLKITNTKVVFTQDFIRRDQKLLPLYEKVVKAKPDKIIVLALEGEIPPNPPFSKGGNNDIKGKFKLRPQDTDWNSFLSPTEKFQAVSCEPHQATNILFSSGTTGEPKAIPWTHTTPIKCATDAYFHLDIHPTDVLSWYTNLGWMMGPWLIYASLFNQATMAIYDGSPTGKAYGQFIQDAKVTLLGVVPSLVKTWRASHCMEDLEWNNIKLFASTGECSNSEEMFYLMWLANYRPIIEYCGGTEIGGAYITGTLLQPAAPATFTTPTLGLDFILLDEQGRPTNNGEVALIPPSIGLSNELLNRDHDEAYFANMPKSPEGKILRRHGDQIEKININNPPSYPSPTAKNAGGKGGPTATYYRALGRVDDTMNLGGIKVSSAEIERTLELLSEVKDTAAIAITPKQGGPSQLVIYAVLSKQKETDVNQLLKTMQQAIREHLNPLFKIHDLILVDSLPRTASNKVMRRVLRDTYTLRTESR